MIPDVKAGWADALRTRRPRPLDGLKFGGLDYATGYAAGTVVSRTIRFALSGS